MNTHTHKKKQFSHPLSHLAARTITGNFLINVQRSSPRKQLSSSFTQCFLSVFHCSFAALAVAQTDHQVAARSGQERASSEGGGAGEGGRSPAATERAEAGGEGPLMDGGGMRQLSGDRVWLSCCLFEEVIK